VSRLTAKVELLFAWKTSWL